MILARKFRWQVGGLLLALGVATTPVLAEPEATPPAAAPAAPTGAPEKAAKAAPEKAAKAAQEKAAKAKPEKPAPTKKGAALKGEGGPLTGTDLDAAIKAATAMARSTRPADHEALIDALAT